VLEGCWIRPSFKDPFLSRRANPNLTIRNFCIAVGGGEGGGGGQGQRHRQDGERAGRDPRGAQATRGGGGGGTSIAAAGAGVRCSVESSA
jgi:hypothetical protein